MQDWEGHHLPLLQLLSLLQLSEACVCWYWQGLHPPCLFLLLLLLQQLHAWLPQSC